MPRFITKKGIELHDQSGGAYNTNKQIRFKTSILRSNLCDYNDPYIVVKGIITVSATDRVNNIRDKKNRPLGFRNNTLFISFHFKNKWCINRKYRRFRHCYTNVQFA